MKPAHPAAPPCEDLPPKAREVLSAARKVFLKHGFSAATTDMIQQEAGVSKATVYAHFPGKEALFLAVIDAECAMTMARIRPVPATDTDLRSRLRRVSEGYLSIVVSADGVALFRAVVAECGRFPQIAARFHEAGPRQFHAMLREILADADRENLIRIGTGGLETAAGAYAGLLRGNLQIAALMSPPDAPVPAAPEGWIDSVIDIFLAAYSANRAM